MTPSDRILSKALAASNLDSSQWAGVQAALRDRAFFSSKIQDIRTLAVMREECARIARGEGSASDARARIREALSRAGVADDGSATLKNPYAKARLDLVLQQNVQSARGYATYMAQTASGPLAAAPGQELVRVRRVRVPRKWAEKWTAAGGRIVGGRMVALKADPVWTKISRFGVPWPPFDFNSGMGVRPLLRSECVRLGLLAEDQPAPAPPPPPGFNDDMSAAVPYANAADWAALKGAFGDQIRIENGMVRWNGSIIRDNFQKGGKFSLHLGVCDVSGTSGKAASPSDAAAISRLLPGHGQLVVDQTWLDRKRRDGTDHRAHFHPLPSYPNDKPLTIGDIELIPSVWRTPDRVYDAGGGCLCYELDSLEGDHYRAMIDFRKQTPVLRTFYRAEKTYR